MFNKALIASAVLAASTSLAFANGGVYQAPHHQHNIYVGVGVSRDFVHYDTHQTASRWDESTGKIIRPLSRHWADFGDDGWNGQIFVGIGWTFQDHWYAGFEAFGSISDQKAEGTWTEFDFERSGFPSTVSKKFELEHSYGISFIPGVKISDSTMLYGRIGWVRSEFDIRDTFAFPAFPVLNTAIRTEDSENALQLGIGLETMVTNNVSARIEYTWAEYDKLHGGAKSGALQGNFVCRNVSVEPTVNEARLDVIYHFMSA